MDEAPIGDGGKWHDADLEQAIRAGEVAYDAELDTWYDPLHADLTIEDFSQRKLARWRREGRIVVEDRTVRMARRVQEAGGAT